MISVQGISLPYGLAIAWLSQPLCSFSPLCIFYTLWDSYSFSKHRRHRCKIKG